MRMQDLYFNHAGTSWPKPRGVAEAVTAAMSVAPARWPQRFDEAHQAIAAFFGVRRPEQILLTPGCTSALAVAVGDLLIPPGKRVLTSRWEHHALHRPLLQLAASGVRVEYIPPVIDEAAPGKARSLDLDWLGSSLADRDVGLVAITAACNVTGELLPLKDVIRLAHDYGTLVLIDAAQVVGWLPLDLPQLGADMVAFGGHKGLQGPWGIGGLYLSEHVPMQCVSATCELPVAGERVARPPQRPGYCDVGSVDQFALAGLHAAIGMLGQQDMEANLARARAQIQRLRGALDRIDGLRICGATADGMPTLALALAGFSSSEVAAQLRRHGMVAGSGLHCAPLAHETLGTVDSGLVRLSVGVGQPDAEIDEAIDRLPLALSQQRGGN